MDQMAISDVGVPMSEPSRRDRDDEGFGAGENPKYNRTLVQLSAEATAAWLGGENIQWTDHFVDPEMRRALGQQREAIRGVIDEACRLGLHPQSDKFLDMLVGALQAGSQQTAQRLQGLREQGDQRLLMAMVLELFDFAHGQQGRDRVEPEPPETWTKVGRMAGEVGWSQSADGAYDSHLPGQPDEDY